MNNTKIEQYPAPKQEYKVLVNCNTYNQSKYIQDTLNGFAMQQTTFPFVCYVLDDASTDGEQEVIKKWMEQECDMTKAETIDIPTSVVIIVPHKTNPSCTFAFYLLKQNLYRAREERMRHIAPWRDQCEYEALCEGDDFWHDSTKLQRQVEFLDTHPSYGLSYSDYHLVDSEGCLLKNNYRHDFFHKYFVDGDILLNLLISNFPQTCTVVFRTSIRGERFPLWGYDFTLFIYYSGKAYVHYLDCDTSCYRVQPKGLTGTGMLASKFFRRMTYQTFIMAANNYLDGYFFKREGMLHYKILFMLYSQLLSPKFMLEFRDEVTKIFRKNILSYLFVIPFFFYKTVIYFRKRIFKGAE